MIVLQTRADPESPWRNLHAFPYPTPKQKDIVRQSKLIARLWDSSTGEAVAESLPAKGIPVAGLKPLEVELALKTFG